QAYRGGAGLELERALRDLGERLPLLAACELLAQRQQRLMRALDLAVQRADGGQQVFDPGRGARLLQARRALVAHEDQRPLALGLVCQGLQVGARFGREIGGCLAAQHGRKLFSDRHDANGGVSRMLEGGASWRTEARGASGTVRQNPSSSTATAGAMLRTSRADRRPTARPAKSQEMRRGSFAATSPWVPARAVDP